VIGTHLDIDHIGGIRDVASRCTIGALFLNVPGQSTVALRKALRQRFLQHGRPGSNYDVLSKSLADANELVDALEQRDLVPQPILAGKEWHHGDCVLRVLNPTIVRLAVAWAELQGEDDVTDALVKAITRTEAPDTSAENDASVVLELVYQGQPYALMSADAGAAVLKEVTFGKTYAFLKVSHHGSETGMDEELAARLGVETAYIPVGDNNYGHPAIEVLDLLRASGVRTYCSDRTRHCRRDCPSEGFGNLCHKHDRESRAGWSSVDSAKCVNNR
jgi:beta-lactamase superfamily II metal-dependent hydrolase